MRQPGAANGLTSTIACIIAAGLLLAGCGGASARATPTAPLPDAAPHASRPSTTTAVTPTTVNPVAADQLTQLVLMSSLNAAKSIYDRTYDYTNVSPASLAPLVANVRFAALGQAGPTVVGLLAQDRNDVFFVTRSASGRWYCVTENATDGVSYGEGTTFAAVNSNGDCQQPAWPAPGTGT